MTKSVLCAVDISNPEDDKSVLAMALRLAEMDNAQLDVITVLPDFGLSVVGSFFQASHHDEAVTVAKKRLKGMVGAVVGADQSTKIRHIVATGSAYQEILKTARKAGTDLIVIGSHTPGLQDYLLGPNAARVVRHSKCSVFVVRDS